MEYCAIFFEPCLSTISFLMMLRKLAINIQKKRANLVKFLVNLMFQLIKANLVQAR